MPSERRLSLWERFFGAKPAPHPYTAPTPEAQVTPDAARCVQCGVCGYNCPVGIAVRDFARQGLVVDDPRCVQCGQCIEVCPRGTLRWGRAHRREPQAPDERKYQRLTQLFFPDESQ